MTKAYRMIRFLSIPHDKEHVSVATKGSIVVMSSIDATRSPGHVNAHLTKECVDQGASLMPQVSYLAAWNCRMKDCHSLLQQPGVSFRLSTLRLKRVFKVEVDSIEVVHLCELNLLLNPGLPVGGVEQLLLGVVGNERHLHPVHVGCLY